MAGIAFSRSARAAEEHKRVSESGMAIDGVSYVLEVGSFKGQSQRFQLLGEISRAKGASLTKSGHHSPSLMFKL